MSELLSKIGRSAFIEIGPVERAGVPIDLTLAGTKLWFTAKHEKSAADEDAIVRKGNAATTLDGITADDPASTDNNMATVVIDPEDTLALDEPTDLYWDIVLKEPGGRTETLDEGVWKLGLPVTVSTA